MPMIDSNNFWIMQLRGKKPQYLDATNKQTQIYMNDTEFRLPYEYNISVPA